MRQAGMAALALAVCAWGGVVARVAAGELWRGAFAWKDLYLPNCLLANVVGCVLIGGAGAVEEALRDAKKASELGGGGDPEATPLVADGAAQGGYGGIPPDAAPPAAAPVAVVERQLLLLGAFKTGFCGAFTTFSSWVVQVAFLIGFFAPGGGAAPCELGNVTKSVVTECPAQAPPLGDDGGSAAVYCFAALSLAATLSLCAAGVDGGARLGRWLCADSAARGFTTAAAGAAAVAVGLGCVFAAHLAGGVWEVAVGAVLVPACGIPGAFLRRHLGGQWNRMDDPAALFPCLGTWAANVLAVAIYAAALAAPPAMFASWWWKAATTGFCGALSTVSSFFAEARGLAAGRSRAAAALYVAASLSGGVAACWGVWAVAGVL